MKVCGFILSGVASHGYASGKGDRGGGGGRGGGSKAVFVQALLITRSKIRSAFCTSLPAHTHRDRGRGREKVCVAIMDSTCGGGGGE